MGTADEPLYGEASGPAGEATTRVPGNTNASAATSGVRHVLSTLTASSLSPVRIRLRICLDLLFILFADFLISLSSLATQTEALLTKSVRLADFSSVTTTTIEESVSSSGGEIGLTEECLGLAKAFHVHPTGILKLSCGIFAEFLAAQTIGAPAVRFQPEQCQS